MELYFLTGNQNKLREVQEMLEQEVKQLDIDLPEMQELDSHKIIEAKMNEAIKHHKGRFIVEDTSLVFEGLNGLPGPLVKWFLTSIGIEGLHRMAKSSETMNATAITMVGYYDGEKIQFIEGRTEGEIVSPAGETKFGWDPIFKPNGHDKTYAEMDAEEKNKISHRGKALRKLKELLSETRQ